MFWQGDKSDSSKVRKIRISVERLHSPAYAYVIGLSYLKRSSAQIQHQYPHFVLISNPLLTNLNRTSLPNPPELVKWSISIAALMLVLASTTVAVIAPRESQFRRAAKTSSEEVRRSVVNLRVYKPRIRTCLPLVLKVRNFFLNSKPVLPL